MTRYSSLGNLAAKETGDMCGCCFRVLQTVALWRTESAILVGWTLAEFGHRISTEVSCGDNLVVGDRGHA
jgi:hypothetical protein